MQMNALRTVALLLAALGAAPSPAPPPAAVVRVKDFAYHPPALTVAPGTTVRFVNEDGEAHTVTAVDRSFDSGGLDTGDAWTHVFAKPGIYRYFCALHPFMKGAIVVRAAGGTTP